MDCFLEAQLYNVHSGPQISDILMAAVTVDLYDQGRTADAEGISGWMHGLPSTHNLGTLNDLILALAKAEERGARLHELIVSYCHRVLHSMLELDWQSEDASANMHRLPRAVAALLRPTREAKFRLISLHDACSMYLLAELIPFFIEAVKALPDQHMAVSGLKSEVLLRRMNALHSERRAVEIRSEDASRATDGNWFDGHLAWILGGLDAIPKIPSRLVASTREDDLRTTCC